MARSGRHLARRCVVQALYQWQLTGQDPEDIPASFIHNEKLTSTHKAWFKHLVGEIPANVALLDDRLRPHLDRGQDDVDLIENAILRLACYELVFEPDVPTAVIIDEAIDLAKTFSAENSYRYVNGVLDKVAREVRGDKPEPGHGHERGDGSAPGDAVDTPEGEDNGGGHR